MATSYENWLSRRKGKQSDLFKLDTKNKTPEENIKEILQGLYSKRTLHNDTSPTNKTNPMEFKIGLRGMQKNGSDSRKLSYLNALVTLLCKEDRSNLGFTPDELMTCIRVSLVDESMVIRAAALRVLRYLIKTESDVATFNNLKLPYLVIRSMDLMLRNEEERAQALRVVRRVVAVVGAAQGARLQRGAFVEHGLLRCLAAVARAASAGDGTGDRLARPAIATLAEICVLNPDMFISCGGVNAVTRQLAECATPRMAEALCGVLLHALNDPVSRRSARIDLMCLSSPYCDFHFRPAGTETSRDEREMRFTCSRLALLCVLRSWPGLLHFCHPCSTGGLRALVAALYLPRLEVRKAILDLLYELVGLPQPEWTDEISVALDAVDPSDFQDSWRLNEGFVAAEGTAILPHLGATGPDIIEIHLALLLQCFLEAGLLDGLAEVIVTSDTFISVRATVLLGQLLHLIHLYLPPQICSITPALPTLMSQASAGKPQALAAVAALRRLHSMLEARPASSSLFLDHIIQYCSGAFREKVEDNTKSRKEKDNASMVKPKHDVSFHKENSIEFLNDSDNENELKQRHSVGSRADVPNRNVGALVKSKSVSSRTSAAVSRVTKSAKFFNLFERDSDNLIRCTLVMQNKDGNTWNWDIIRTILKENDTPLLNLNDSGHKAWVTRIINYLKPSSNKYSHTDLSSTCHGHSATRAGCQLIRHLLRHNDLDCQRLLEDLFSDVSRQIEAIETGLKAHECLFSPQHMCNTMCQMYFLFIGQLCHSHSGLRLFKQTGLYENLLELSTKTHHSCYVKLVISSLDYTLDSYPRDILAKTLTCNIQASRLYTTQFLNVLLRASTKSRELVRRKAKLKKNLDHMKSTHKDNPEVNTGVDMDTWILQMLIGQVKDESKAVIKIALTILEEAYHVPSYVEKLVTMKELLCQNCHLDKAADPSSLDFGAVSDRGYLLWLSLEVSVAVQSVDAKSIAFLKKHLDFWTKSYNYRYVRLVEAGVHEALAVSSAGGARGLPRARRAARPPPHVHAALAPRAPPAARARALLAAVLPEHYKILQRKKCATEQEIADIKASLWAVGNTAVTSQGLQQLMSLSNGYLEDSVLVHIVRLAKYNPVYSVRATAFYVLGLIGSTYDGANLLSDLGWLCVRHTRYDQFPIIPDETSGCNFEQGSNVHYYVTSPECRYNAYDAELSEHSDHTDQSVAESLHSETTKQFGKTGSISADTSEIKDQDVTDNKVYADGRPDKRKSHTLPSQGVSSSHDRPTLSESRTVDILRDCSSYERHGPHRMENRLVIGRMNSLEHAHEGRVRNTSESSTSGVSSCDSFLGKYAIPDRVLTLSPIPSSSSLYGMKSSNSSHRPKIPELQRRTSTSSFAGHEVASSPPSQMDMTGYATLKSLNRRPHLSESAATGSTEMDDLSWLLSDTNRRTKPFSSLRDRAKTTKERMTKLSLLEYDWKPLPLGESSRSSPPAVGVGAGPAGARRRTPSATLPQPPPNSSAHSPAYIGICLPRDLMELFPRDEEKYDEDTDKSEHTKRGRLPSFLVDTSSASTENKSRATPDSQKLTSQKAGSNIIAVQLHKASSNSDKTDTTVASNADTSTASVEPNDTNTRTPKDKPKRLVTTVNEDENVTNTLSKKTAEGSVKTVNNENKSENVAANNEDSQGTSQVQDGLDPNRSIAADGESVAQSIGAVVTEVSSSSSRKWRHATADCLACVRTRPPSSHELREAFFADMDASGSITKDTRSPVNEKADRGPQAELLHQVHFMSNPIHLRQARSVLLSMKQRHLEVFRSPCVYSDVCALLARDTYMLCARRFVQELFLDTNFDCFATEPAAVLKRHGVTTPSDRISTDVHQ
ncbi:rapamycin-insensitive companion of mTOR [Trichoplusia ni]|uniref:Rapamycin-insensitive companion of mTOR n=1 Tax=Trichoplusia ni TaxID=7111 RepID=A0A7E5VM20_TRINI|nr:rapamycin-insensitive companion of mTOR [Trichoplusia ni]